MAGARSIDSSLSQLTSPHNAIPLISLEISLSEEFQPLQRRHAQKSRFTHNYFYIRDEVLGPMVMRVATFFPFQTTYYLNGHNYIEQELNRANIAFRKHDVEVWADQRLPRAQE